MTLENKVALVTGAARGIGKAIALNLAKQGAIVIGADIGQEQADLISNYLKEYGYNGEGIVMNVSDQESVLEGLSKIKDKYGSVSILINNAGITRDNLMLRMKPEEWHSVINVNLNSVFYTSQACLRDMVKNRWGRIVNLASVVGLIGNAGQANYTATKAGVIAFSKSLAQEVGPRGITVNCVAPGFIETEMTSKLSDEHKAAYMEKIPLRRAGSVDDIANAVSFLVSDEAAYITGSTISVNGGMFMQ
ncbi:MAG: 3-oxoacyl-ACP reductase FabG [Gammaproteobacteria bacterium]|nr:3-oxoacyl-ACP reductase FabG [Gammaproteobacteria bacterium]